MKIVCPCCDQEYDVDENLLNIELECSKCHNHFYAVPASICSGCGTANYPQSLKCRLCGQQFASMPLPPPAEEMPAEEMPAELKAQMTAATTPDFFEKIRSFIFEITTMCPQCRQEYRMLKYRREEVVVCSVCDQKFSILPVKKCPRCHTLNPFGAGMCAKCRHDLKNPDGMHKYLEESPLKQVFFWPVALFTLLWAYTGHWLLQMIFSGCGNVLFAYVSVCVIYYAILFGLLFCCRIMSGKFLRFLQWPFGVNLFLTSAVVGYCLIPLLLSAFMLALVLLPVGVLGLWLLSLTCKLCNPEFPIKRVIGYGAAGGIVLCLLALCI